MTDKDGKKRKGKDKQEDTAEEVAASNEATAKIDISKLKDELEEQIFKEGEEIPEVFRSQCKKNDYGGYTLRLGKFIYMLDGRYRVEVKQTASQEDYDLVEDEKDRTILFPTMGASVSQEDIELEKGDLLPEHLRTQCEVDLSIGGGSRIKIGPYLYLLDNDFRVTARMKVSISDA